MAKNKNHQKYGDAMFQKDSSDVYILWLKVPLLFSTFFKTYFLDFLKKYTILWFDKILQYSI